MKEFNSLWQDFAIHEQLNEQQLEQFKRYFDLLVTWNTQINLTAIIQPRSIIKDHFSDSLHLGHVLDLNSITMLADVGSGGGFPGIPLKIKFPELSVILIEVTQKKIAFLRTVIEELNLENIHVHELDWRTFFRTTSYPVDLFVARASLPVEELLRLFKPSCPYNKARLVYWASQHWQPSNHERLLLEQEIPYKVGNKQRYYFIFSREKRSL
jgi:16S rRNA (guanine(527)-N(7))-methyltransferase RsmG